MSDYDNRINVNRQQSKESIINSKVGVKFDEEKPDLSLLSPIAIFKIAEVMSYGSKKYDSHNWRKGFKFSRVLAAILRHLFSYLRGENKDPESGLSHLGHAACGIFFLLEFEETHPEMDDRYKV